MRTGGLKQNKPGAAVNCPETEETPRSNEKLFQIAFAQAGVGFAITDRNGRFVKVNQAYCRITGYLEEDLYAMDFNSITYGEDLPKNLELMQRLFAREIESFVYQQRYVTKAGHFIWVQNSVSGIPDNSGAVSSFITLTQDITDRKRAEEELLRSEAFLAEGQALSHTGSWQWNPSSGETLWSKETFRIFGLDPTVKPLSQEAILRYVHSDDRSAIEQIVNRAVREKCDCEIECRIVLPDQTVKHIHSVGRFVLRSPGKLLEFVGTIMDITDRKQEQELRSALAAVRADVGNAFTIEGSLPQILNGCTEALVRHLGLVYARIWTLNPDGKKLDLQASSNMPTHLNGSRSLMWIEELDIGFIAQERKPILTNNVVKHFGIDEASWARPEGMVAFAGYPLVVEDRVVGVMALFSRKMLTPATLETLASVADSIAQGMDRKRTEEEVRRLSGRLLQSQDEERRKIARDLHDSTGQDLVALATTLGQLHSSIPSSNRKSRKLVSECQVVADQCIREVRTLSYLLHPPLLEKAGLGSAIRHYAEGLAKRTEIRVHLEMSPNFGRVNRDVELVLFRIVQESLRNIERHAGSPIAKIHVQREPGKIKLEISDQGHGFSRRAQKTTGAVPVAAGVGIPSMYERVKHIGGQLDIKSSRSGTCVQVTIPTDE
jgi:PAS domain S-box-containing protein